MFLFRAFSCTRLIGDLSSEYIGSAEFAAVLALLLVLGFEGLLTVLEVFWEVEVSSDLVATSVFDATLGMVGVGDTDLALEGIKGTEAGFKFDFIVVLPEVVEGVPDEVGVFDECWTSFSFFNALAAAECLAD